MKFRFLWITVLAALIGLAVYLTNKTDDRPLAKEEKTAPATHIVLSQETLVSSEPPESPPQHPTTVFPATQKPRTEESRAVSRRNLAYPLVESSMPDLPKRSSNMDSTSEIDMDKITLMLRDYRTITGENPVGTNAEIMKSIMGGNPKGAMLGPPKGQSMNGNGELIDRWGTPYFFHQLTKDLMEIHSAGPDQKMWTEDDLISK